MATAYLGPEFDIHGGGLDLVFPHHENEQAQSHAAGDPFARYWLHNAWVTMGGEKMSKSLGNTLSIEALLGRVRGVELRYYLVGPHYRSAIEYSDAALAGGRVAPTGGSSRSCTACGSGTACPSRPRTSRRSSPPRWTTTWAHPARWPSCTTRCARATRRSTRGDATAREPVRRLRAGDDRAARRRPARAGRRRHRHRRRGPPGPVHAGRRLLEQRQRARAERDFATADRLRDELLAAGVSVEDGAGGSTWSLKDA